MQRAFSVFDAHTHCFKNMSIRFDFCKYFHQKNVLLPGLSSLCANLAVLFNRVV